MKTVSLTYTEIGSVCMIDKKDFDIFWSRLHKVGVEVKSRRLTKRALDGAKAPRKSKRSAKSPRK